MAEHVPLPTFLIIGAQRSATRWLRVNLNLHEDVFMTPRETEFFCDVANMTRVYSGELPEYRQFFDGWDGETAIGESCPAYFWPTTSREVSWRIRGCLPDVRLVLILRNPVDRYYSAIFEAVKVGALPADTDPNFIPAEFLASSEILTTSQYFISYEIYHRLFGEQLKTVIFDDLVADPGSVYDDVLAHIGVTTGFRPERLAEPLFSSRRISQSLAPITEDNRKRMYETFEAGVVYLEEQLERELPAWHWDDQAS